MFERKHFHAPQPASSRAESRVAGVMLCAAFWCAGLGQLSAAEAASVVPRTMIEVGGFKLETARAGEKGPTVVFELGAGGTLDTWRNILPRVADTTTAFSYTRAGRGKSEKSTAPRTPSQIAEELHALLEHANVPKPYVLVGRSLGGIYVRVFAIKYPRDVAGLVLIDPSHERQDLEFSKVLPDYAASLTAQDPRPEIDAAQLKAGQPPFPGKVPDIPTILITSAGSGDNETSRTYKRVWRDLHNELFAPVRDGMHIVTTRSGHAIQDHEPELVLTAIRWVVDRARSKRPTPPPPTSSAN